MIVTLDHFAFFQDPTADTVTMKSLFYPRWWLEATGFFHTLQVKMGGGEGASLHIRYSPRGFCTNTPLSVRLGDTSVSCVVIATRTLTWPVSTLPAMAASCCDYHVCVIVKSYLKPMMRSY